MNKENYSDIILQIAYNFISHKFILDILPGKRNGDELPRDYENCSLASWSDVKYFFTHNFFFYWNNILYRASWLGVNCWWERWIPVWLANKWTVERLLACHIFFLLGMSYKTFSNYESGNLCEENILVWHETSRRTS